MSLSKHVIIAALTATLCFPALSIDTALAADPHAVGEKSFSLRCGDDDTVAAYSMALRVVASNIKPWRRGLLESEVPALMAGGGYASPWTRDAAYNTYFAAGLLHGDVAKNTLLSVLEIRDGSPRIVGQYWDSICWVTGAWEYYVYTGDEAFLRIAYDAASHTLGFLERTEFDSTTGLFCGPGWSDGVAGYPQPYNRTRSSFILDYARDNESIDKIRMKALSTNCLYYNAYRLTARMGRRLREPDDSCSAFEAKAAAIRAAINRHLWMEEEGRYAYFLDRDGKVETSIESLGHSFAILFGVADAEQAEQIFAKQFVSPNGVPCNWPIFPRFGSGVGRHSGAVWPQIQGFWALAAASKGKLQCMDHELAALTRCALASGDFREIYHPFTGEPEGGLQVGRQWTSQPRQTWAATAYLAMLYRGVVGMRFETEGISFQPLMPQRLGKMTLSGVKYRGAELDISITGYGHQIASVAVDGTPRDRPVVSAELTGRHAIEIQMVPSSDE